MILPSRLGVKSVREKNIEVIFEKDMLQEITKVEVWNHNNQNKEWIEKEWDPIDDNEYWKGFKVVNVKQLEEGHTYDIRLVDGNEGKVLTREGVKTGGKFDYYTINTSYTYINTIDRNRRRHGKNIHYFFTGLPFIIQIAYKVAST